MLPRRTLRAALALLALSLGCERSDRGFAGLAPPRPPERIDRPDAAAARGGDRPNLLLISLDTLRADHLTTYGYGRATSPRIDRLAAGAVVFERASSHSPKTAPSHMSLMTGLYPEAHRVQNRFADTSTWVGRLSDDLPTLPEILRAAGYRTSARTGGGNMHGDIGFARGFDSYESPSWAGPAILRAAVAELERLAEGPEPFFLLFHTYQVHAPYLPPRRLRDVFVSSDYAGRILSDPAELARIAGASLNDIHTEFWSRVDRESVDDRAHLRDLYDACIRFADQQVGVLLDRLEALGLHEDTIVVLLSDHGEQFGEHGGFEHSELWRELLHVPLVVRVPAALRPGWGARRVADPVGLVDVLPTLLELLEVPAPGHLQGQSLVAQVEAAAPAPGWVFSQNRETGDLALRAGRWKLLRSEGHDRLYDLEADPAEREDLGAAEPELRGRAAGHLARVIAASRAYWPLVREGRPMQLDDETRRRLEALGYVDRAE